MNRKIKIAFICTPLLVLCSWILFQQKNVEVKIRAFPHDFSIQMPLKDKKRLTYLFYEILIRDDAAYTLFGNKPMSINGLVKPFSTLMGWDIFWMSVNSSNIRLYQSWKTWLKYAPLFESSRFLLSAETNPYWPEPNDAICILTIDKKKFAETIRAHKGDFEQILQAEDINGERLLQQATHTPLLKTILKSHDGLIGTLLGYGRNNAWLYEEKKRGSQISMVSICEPIIYSFFANRPKLAWTYFGILEKDLSLVLGYPTFLADPNSVETKTIKQDFIHTREKILSYYEGKDFLEATFDLLLAKPESLH
jgi:hypothetical protein